MKTCSGATMYQLSPFAFRTHRPWNILLHLIIFYSLTVPDPIMALNNISDTKSQSGTDKDESNSIRDDDRPDSPDLSIEADLELNYEIQSDSKSSEITFDEIGITIEGEWYEVIAGIKYESATQTVLIEEASVRIGGSDEIPWFIQAGRTILPFVESNTSFAEDPGVILIGETDKLALIGGFEGEDLEFAFGIYRGDQLAGKKLNVSITISTEPLESAVIGLGFTTNLGESTELQEISEDFTDDTGSAVSPRRWVSGIAAYMISESESFVICTEFLSALDSFDRNFLDDERHKPVSWNIETGILPADNWYMAVRMESTRDLPDNPRRQYGLAVGYELSEHVDISLEYLYGDFADEDESRHLITSAMSFRLY